MKKSNNKGFTLVELVVVIAIIGVLAAILVPSMMGYVKKARLKTANGNAKTAYNGASDYMAEMETAGHISEVGNSDAANAAAYELSTNGDGAGVVWIDIKTADLSTADVIDYTAYWRKTSSDDITGKYPDAPSSVEKSEALSPAGASQECKTATKPTIPD